ncbi:MAG: sulfatase-like hydrolase/transferase [Elusimicrobia bacterium]|nr:sulfatase-like hydrolase/transferase [Elusimicrobiota bacterium]
MLKRACCWSCVLLGALSRPSALRAAAEQPGVSSAPVRIGYFHGGRTNVVYRTYVEGYFEAAGVPVELYTAGLHDRTVYKLPRTHDEIMKHQKGLGFEEFSKMRGTEIVDAMLAGKVDAGTIGESSFIQCVAEDKPITAVALLGYDTRARPGHVIALRKGVVINSPADFHGKTLVTRRAGPGDYIFLKEFLASIGMGDDPTIKVLAQVPDDEIARQLENKEVDGGYYHLMTAHALERYLYPYRPLNWLNPEMSQAVLVFRNDFIARHPDLVQKVVNAYIKRIAYERTLPPEKVDKSWDKGLMMKAEYAGMMIPQYDLPPRVRPELLEAMQDLLLKYGFIKKKKDLKGAIDDSFVEKGMDALAGPCAFSGKYQGYNLLLVSITNIGANHMSLYGYGRRTTPLLEDWAKDALVFDNAFTHASWTLPVGVTLFTSLYPYAHQIFVRHFKNVLEASVRTLPEILRDSGYRTAAFTGGLDYNPGFSHMRGFQDAPENPTFSSFKTTIPQARKWLAENGGKRFMLFVHGYDAHCPFLPDRPFKGAFSDLRGKTLHFDPRRCVRGLRMAEAEYEAEYAGGCPKFPKTEKCPDDMGKKVRLTQDDIDFLSDSYDEKVLETDSMVGGFLRSLDAGLLAKTIVVVVSEHGEMFAKHGRFGRAGTRRGTSYDDILHVPVIIKFPGAPARRVSGLVGLVDLMPSLLDALGLPAPAGLQGKSLASLVESGASANRYVFSGAPYNTQGLWDNTFDYWSRTESIRDERWKLIYESSVSLQEARKGDRAQAAKETSELYDIAEDPEESREVSGAHPDVAAGLREKLRDWGQRVSAKGLVPTSKTMPDELLRQARERGYWQP